MEATFGSYYTDDSIGERELPDNSEYLASKRIFSSDSQQALNLGKEFRTRLAAGERLILLGFLGTTHNSGISIVEASKADGVVVLANHEEERFSEIKHFAGYPTGSVEETKRFLRDQNIDPKSVFGVFYAYDVVQEEQSGMRMQLVNSKIIRNKYYKFITESASPHIEFTPELLAERPKNIFLHSPALVAVFEKLVGDLNLRSDICCIQMLHHENHAYFSYGVSPFARGTYAQQPTMVSCIDGGGDLSSVSLFRAEGSKVELLGRNYRADSLGVFYMLCASLLGGWTALSAEGRYMGAAAWGNGDRLTNPYYKQLRQFFFFRENGRVSINANLAADEFKGLEEIVGPFVPIEDIWKPDAVINVDAIQHSPITKDRVDKAAAVQMVFEDALFHIIQDLILTEKSNQLVLCGGTALNCVSSMRLLQHFDRKFFQTYLDWDTQLNVWIPPVPSDQGVVIGAAYQFAMANGADPKQKLETPFLCGKAPLRSEIEEALNAEGSIEFEVMGSIADESTRGQLADWMAYLVSQDSVIGIFQGAAETGPRALGHRSILSNPCNHKVLELLNGRVKRREKIRPLAPMVTLEEARKWFHLSEGASADHYDAYNYMVLTAFAKDEAKERIPAVVHHDGTSRIQIVREDNNALMHAYLKALKKHIGVEVSVNTSLNVGTPIVQTPRQALQVFERSKGFDGLFLIAEDGAAYMAWAKKGVQEFESRIPELKKAYANADTENIKRKHTTVLEVLQAFAAEEISEHEVKCQLEELRY